VRAVQEKDEECHDSLFWLGWSSRLSIHPVMPMMSGVFFGFGYLLIFIAQTPDIIGITGWMESLEDHPSQKRAIGIAGAPMQASYFSVLPGSIMAFLVFFLYSSHHSKALKSGRSWACTRKRRGMP
jgi:hypothetical protein